MRSKFIAKLCSKTIKIEENNYGKKKECYRG